MSSKHNRPVRSQTAIGLDVGSSAVRAAQLVRNRRGQAIERFAQIGLPSGAVIDGEIVQAGTVATALRRLWVEGGFSSRNVVLSLSGQRVIVRQAEVPSMSEADFRSALRFQAMELIPIPVDDAVLDFVILPKAAHDLKQSDRMQILLGAAHRHVIDTHLAVLREASLRAIAIDPAPMSAARGGVRTDGAVALLDIGSDLTTITVAEERRVRFSRTLNSGGSDLTGRVSSRRAVPAEQAEALKRDAAQTGQLGVLLIEDIEPLVAEIESSLSFFASQLGGEAPEHILITGGPSGDPALIEELARRLPMTVEILDPLVALDLADLDLDPVGVLSAQGRALLPVGAAQWAFDQPTRRLSLLPSEAAAIAGARRRMLAAGAGVALLAAVLGAGTVARSHQVSRAQAEAAAAVQSNADTQARITALAPVTRFDTAVATRLALLTADGSDDIAWTSLLDEISAAMPPGLKLASVAFDDAGAGATGASGSTSGITSGSGSSASGATSTGPLGSVTMSVTGPGSEEQVALWLRALGKVQGLTGVSIPSAAVSRGKVTFTSSAGLTSGAPLVMRASSVVSGS
jgi:type IV pilus assembly protein PilM